MNAFSENVAKSSNARLIVGRAHHKHLCAVYGGHGNKARLNVIEKEIAARTHKAETQQEWVTRMVRK